MRRFRPYLAVALIAAALLSWWLVRQQQAPDAVRAYERDGPREIDYSLTGFDVTRMGPDGQPAHRLRAERLQHFIDDDTSELIEPRLTVFQGEEPPWQVQSAQAWISADGSIVLLTGDVLIDRAAGSENPPVRLTTRNLRLQPREDYAETDEKVRVETDMDRLDAVGMQAWLRPPSRLKFLSQVKGYYVPR